MKIKSNQEQYNLLVNQSHWHQQPCPIDDDYTIITIRIPNKNVKREEEYNGLAAFYKIMNFCLKLPLLYSETHFEITHNNPEAFKVISDNLNSLENRISYIVNKIYNR